MKNGANLKAQGGDQNNSALQISCMLGDLRSVRAFMDYMQSSQQEDIWTEILFLQNKVGECALDLARLGLELFGLLEHLLGLGLELLGFFNIDQHLLHVVLHQYLEIENEILRECATVSW
jgi:hypothetical protein